MTTLRPNAFYSFFDPKIFRSESIYNGVCIRSETERDERILEYIGRSQLTDRHVFWNANDKEFELIGENSLQFLKEVV